MKYKAFISYRHLEPDMTAAKKLHTLIETFRIPKSVKISKNITEMGKVFRDEEELPTSTNLSDDIEDALKNSEWLIVICTPNTPKSRWCMKEIDTFIELGKRDHILALLVSGTPEESFPEQLKYIVKDGKRVEVEPLAANIVASSKAESIRKLKVEKLRLLAPMLGVAFDDLKQRERERKIRRRLAISSGIIAGLLAFSAYAVVQNNRIQKERTAALVSQSEYLADASESALENGDRMLALMLGLEALPSNFEKPEKPIVASAVEALRSAVIYGVGSDSYAKVTDIEYSSANPTVYSDKDTIYIFGDSKPYVQSFDLRSGKETSDTLKFGYNEKPDKVFMDDRSLPLAIYGTKAESITSGGDIRDMNVPEEMEYVDKVSFNDVSDKRVIYGKNQAYLWSAFGSNIMVTLPENFVIDWVKPASTGMFAAVSPWKSDVAVYQFHVGYIENAKDPEAHILREFVIPYDDIGINPNRVTRFECNSFAVNKSGSMLAYVGGTTWMSDFLLLWNAGTGDFVRYLTAEDLLGKTQNSYFKDIEFDRSGDNLVITSASGKCLIYNTKTESKTRLDAGLYSIQTAHFNSDGTKVLCSTTREGLIFDSLTGELCNVLPAGFEINDAVFADTDVYGSSTFDMAILLKGRNGLSIYKTGVEENSEIYNAAVVLDELGKTIQIKNCDFSKDKTRFFVPEGEYIYVFDTETGKKIAEVEDSSRHVICISDEKLLAYNSSDSESPSSINIYNAATYELLATITPEYEHWADGKRAEDKEFCYGSIKVSEAGDTLVLTATDYNNSQLTKYFRTAVFAYDANTYEELWRVSVKDSSDMNDRVFDEAKTWEGRIEMSSDISGTTATILYRYGDYGLVVEQRNLRSGELLNRYAVEDARTEITVLNPKTISSTSDLISCEYSQLAYTLKSEDGEKGEKVLYLADLADGSPLNSIELDGPCAVIWLSEKELCLIPDNNASEDCYIWNTADNTLTKILFSDIKDTVKKVTYPKVTSLGYQNYMLIKDATPTEIAASAKALLRGRELTVYQRKAYHIEK